MTATSRRLELSLLTKRFAVARLAPEAAIPAWATQGSFFSVTRTSDELSVVCEESRIPTSIQAQPGWRVFQVHGPFAFSEVGVMAALTAPLAVEQISVFVVSTYDTDYLLVNVGNLAPAITALERAGHTIHRSKPE
jgi:hypothetical protein